MPFAEKHDKASSHLPDLQRGLEGSCVFNLEDRIAAVASNKNEMLFA